MRANSPSRRRCCTRRRRRLRSRPCSSPESSASRCPTRSRGRPDGPDLRPSASGPVVPARHAEVDTWELRRYRPRLRLTAAVHGTRCWWLQHTTDLAIANRSRVNCAQKGKGKGKDYSAAYMSQTRDQQCFTISEVAADWHEPMVPQCITWPSIAHAKGQLDQRCS